MDRLKRSNDDDHEVEHSIGSSKRYKKAIDSSAEELVCPLTLELPIDPVMAEDGKVYERTAIKDHIQRKELDLRSPVTNEPIGKRLFPALQVRNVIEQLVGSGAIEGDKAKRWNDEMEKRKKASDLRQRAEAGDADAMFCLARCYRDGKGVKKDRSMAYTWYKKAADCGHVMALAAAGSRLVRGIDVAANNALGMVFLGRAEAEGSDLAAYYLGTWLCKGYHGLPLDPVQGKVLLRKVVSGTCKFKNLKGPAVEKAANLLRELDGPAVIAPEPS